MIRVLMLSKACVVGIYQRKLELIAQEPDIELLALVPPGWRDERGFQPLERVYTSGYRLQETPILFNGNFHLHLYPQFGRWLSEFRPDVVHIDEEPYNLATWQALWQARRAGAKTLFFSWQNIAREYPFPFSQGERWVLGHIDHALVGTFSSFHIWRMKGYNGPMTIVPQFGVDPELFRPAVQRPDRPFTIGYFGRLVPEKGLSNLLNASARLTGDWRLRIVGSGPEESALKAQAAGLGIADRVCFDAYQPSTAMPDLYRELDVFVLPSLTRPNWKEQFGRVLIEAMSSGVPVVGSDSGAIPDVIGNAGLVFPEGDSASLYGHLATLQQDAELQAHLAESGRARVLEHFTHASVASTTAEVYRELTKPQR